MSLINTPVQPFKTQAFLNGKFIDVSDESLKGKWSVLIFMPAAFTFNCPTEVEDAAGEALVDGDGFHLANKQFERSPLDEANLDDHALAGHAELRGESLEPWRNRHQDTHADHDRPDDRLQKQQGHADDHDGDRFQEDDPVQPRPLDDSFTRKQIRFDVSHACLPTPH